MEFVVSDIDKLKDSVKLLNELVTEATIEVKSDGWNVAAMDTANVAMCVWKMPSSKFVAYSGEGKFAINVTTLLTVLKRATKDDSLTIKVGDKMELTFKNGRTRKFSVPISTEDSIQSAKMPALEHDVKVELDSKLFADMIGDCTAIESDSVLLVCKDGKVSALGEGELMKVEEDFKEEADKDKKVKGKYSVEYLEKMVKAASLSEKVTVCLKTDYPLQLEYGNMVYILAPRVDSDN